MNATEILAELKSLGTAQTLKTFLRHGAQGDVYGVKVGDLKKILKRIKGNQAVALQLWETGNSDAMYLAAMAADGKQMTRAQLNAWAKSASWSMLNEYAVPSVAAEHPDATAIATKWIGSKQALVAAAGWNTYALAIAVRPDSELDFAEIKQLLKTVEAEIATAENRVRYCMNAFVISVGSYVEPLLKAAKSTAKKIGIVHVDLGDTACKVPLASDYLRKIEDMGRIGQKRKSTKC